MALDCALTVRTIPNVITVATNSAVILMRLVIHQPYKNVQLQRKRAIRGFEMRIGWAESPRSIFSRNTGPAPNR
jgi:hypothetical protein